MFAKVFVFVVLLSIIQTKAADVAFIKLGSYGDASGSTKEYYISRYFKVPWVDTRPLCKAYDMDVVSFESRAEADAFLIFYGAKASAEEQIHVGGMTLAGKNAETWYWVNSGRRIDYGISFAPNQPDNEDGVENCLTAEKLPNNKYLFNDVDCQGSHQFKFICQKIVEGVDTETAPQP